MSDVYLVRARRRASVVSLDVHKLSIVAATLPPAGGKPAREEQRNGIRR